MNALPLVLLLLGASVLGVALFRRAALPPVLGYLLVGTLIGPHALNLVGDPKATGHLAEFGVVFLMFSIGLEFSLPRLNAMKRTVFGLGGLQVTVTALLVLLATIALFGSWQAGVVLGGVLAMSSTAVLVKLLGDRNELESRHGRLVVGVLLFQDLAVVPLLVLNPALSRPPGEMLGMVLLALLKAAVMLGLVLYVGQRVLGPWFRFVARGRSAELFVLNVLLVTLGLAWLTELAGLSLALGAFVAGMLISETEFRHQVEEDIKPFRDILMGLFFVTVGMQLDMPTLWEHWQAVLGLLSAVVLAKGLIVGVLARAFGESPANSLRAGLWLCAGGEFGFVLLSEARSSLLPTSTSQVVLAALVLSLLLAPLLVHYSERLVMRVVSSEWLLRSMELTRIAAQTIATERHAIVLGFGRNGQHLVRFLAREGISYVALDLDPERVHDAAAAGESVVFGDASRRETLIAAGLKRASVVVVTFANVPLAERILEHVRQLRPEVPVIVRVEDDRDLDRLFKAGATEVVPEALESSLMLASHALLLLGTPPRLVLRRIRETRKERYQLLRGLFRGVSDESLEDEDFGSARLHSVVLMPGAYAVGRTIRELDLKSLDIEVSAVRRRGIRALEPSSDTKFEAGDIVVLLARQDQLASGERRLLQG